MVIKIRKGKHFISEIATAAVFSQATAAKGIQGSCIVVGNGHSDQSLNTGWSCLQFTQY